MIIKCFKDLWETYDIRSHPNMLFIYSTDLEGTHRQGQACIRYERNAMGIPARIRGGIKKEDYFNDNDIEKYKPKIRKAVDNIIAKLSSPKNKYTGVVLPEKGIGNLKADGDLNERAPLTYEFVISEVNRLIKLIGKIEYVRHT